MITLGVDTSEPVGGVALWRDGPVAERMMDAPLRHSESLLPLIDRILADNGCAIDEIERVSVNRGPGSFTGLRIGMATAKGFCQARRVPLIGVDGTVAHRARLAGVRRVCVALVNRRDLLYVRSFSGLRPNGPVSIMRTTELLAHLRREERELTLVGSGATTMADRIRDLPHIRMAAGELNRPSPMAIAQLGAEAAPTNEVYELEPLYVEPVLAQGGSER